MADGYSLHTTWNGNGGLIFTSVRPTGAAAKNLFSAVLSAGINKWQVSKWRKFHYIIHAINTSRIHYEKMVNAENRSECVQLYEGSMTWESTSAPYYKRNAKDRLLARVQKLKFRQAFQLQSLGLFWGTRPALIRSGSSWYPSENDPTVAFLNAARRRAPRNSYSFTLQTETAKSIEISKTLHSSTSIPKVVPNAPNISHGSPKIIRPTARDCLTAQKSWKRETKISLRADTQRKWRN
jgi:hypothetical protein